MRAAVCFVLLATACGEPSSTVPKDRESCLRAGGLWGGFGIAGIPRAQGGWGLESCRLPTKDGGRSCRDNSECEALCTTHLNWRRHKGKSTTGTCYQWHSFAGECLTTVRDGKVAGMLCAD